MSEYKTIFGKAVKALASDPTDTGAEGQIWYNTTTGSFRTVLGTAAWSSGSNRINAMAFAAGFGTQTSALTAGGRPAGGGSSAKTEEYNGSGFSAKADLNQARSYLAGCGNTTAGLVFGGFFSPPAGARNESEEYDGSTWTAGNNLGTARYGLAGAGTQTAGLAFGGNPPISSATEEYDGTSWTAGGSMNTARKYLAGFGIQTAAIAAGGNPSTPTVGGETELYNGSTWSEVNDLNTSRGSGLGGAGTSTSGIIMGGLTTAPAPGTGTGATETWDGTNWSTSPATLATGRYSISGAGANNTAAVAMGGRNAPDSLANTEEYNFSASVITPAAWSSGGTLNTSRFGLTGFGTQTAAIAANGDTYPPATGRFTNAAEEYNGATWTNIASTNTSTSFAGSSKLSPAGAGSVFGGEPVSTRHEYWDGSTWSEQTDMNTPRYGSAGAGTQTSSLAMAGIADTDATEEWDGSSWTTTANVPFLTFQTPGAGSQTAAIIFGGNGPSGVNTTAEYNSGTWTTGGNLISPKTNQGGAGTQTAALSFMGSFPTTASVVTTTEGYDGTAWSTRPSAATARRTLGSAGTQTAALGFGGYTPGKTTATEEFTGEVVTANPASNLSVS